MTSIKSKNINKSEASSVSETQMSYLWLQLSQPSKMLGNTNLNRPIENSISLATFPIHISGHRTPELHTPILPKQSARGLERY